VSNTKLEYTEPATGYMCGLPIGTGRLAAMILGTLDPERVALNQVDPYQPSGDLHFRLNHGPVTSYHRELDLERAVVSVAYEADGCHYRREYVAHLACDLILVRLTADRPFKGRFWLDRIEDPECFLRKESEGSTNTVAIWTS
jgi:hypothetical protein